MKVESSKTVEAVLREAAERLHAVSPSARLDAEVILGHLLGCDRLQLVMRPGRELSLTEQAKFQSLIDRRADFEPVAYLTGKKEFYGLDFCVTPDVLVPRPETELLVERAVDFLINHRGTRFVDLGTGSGCIAVAIAHTLKERGVSVAGIAVDKSSKALSVALENARRLGVGGAIEFREGEWLSPLGSDEEFDLLVSNPPYIAPEDMEISPELRHEPAQALYSGEKGLADIALILRSVATRTVRPKGLLIEIGASQGEQLKRMIEKGEFGDCYLHASVELATDLAGYGRIIAVTFQTITRC